MTIISPAPKTPLAASPREAMPPVWAVVLTYNGEKFLADSLGTLLATAYPNLHVLLVDNGSQPELADWVRAHYPQVEQLRIEKNIGFARAANRGMQAALERGARYVALFDDDTAVPQASWLGEVIEQIEGDLRVGVVGFPQTTSLEEAARPVGPITLEEVAFVVGFALVFRDSLLRDVGMFEEVLVAFAEEDDLELRAQAAGYRVLRANLPIYHVGGATHANYTRSAAYLQMRNGLRHQLKHQGLRGGLARAVRMLDIVANPWPLTLQRNNAAHLRMRNNGNCLVNSWLWLKACTWNLLHLSQTLASRRSDRSRNEYARQLLARRLAHECHDTAPALAPSAATVT